MELGLPSVHEVAMMSPVELQSCAQELDVLRRQVEAASAVLVQRVDAVSAFVEDGHRNVSAWGRATNHWSHGEAAGMTKLAKAFSLLPRFAETAQAGGIGVAQMHAVAKLAANPRVRDHLDAEADRVLTEGARDLPFDDLITLLRHFEALADADGAKDRHDRAMLDRRAAVHFVDERAFLDAAGPAFDGVMFSAVLDHYAEQEWNLEWKILSEVHGDRMCAELMERTPAQRRFDALQRIFTAAAAGSGGGKAPAITVDILIDQATYEHQLAMLLGGVPDPMPVSHATERRCEDPQGHLVDPAAVVAASLVGQVRRMVLAADGVVLDMGRRQRLFTGALRDAVMLTSRRCGHLGCGLPGHLCEVDHTIPYARGGPTSARNGGLECDGHNRWRNNGAFTFRDRKGRWRTFRPDGTEIGWPTIVATLGLG